MSVKALTKVFDCTVGDSALKSVLIAVADRADDKTGRCFPSSGDTVERTELDRKTVLAKMKILEAEKILVDSGDRVGRTKQVKVWILDLARLEEFSLAQKSRLKMEQSQKRNGSDFPQEESQISAETVPETGHGTGILPLLNHHLVGCESIELMVEAAVWSYKKSGHIIVNEAGFRFKKRNRLRSFVGPDDKIDLENYLLHLSKKEGQTSTTAPAAIKFPDGPAFKSTTVQLGKAAAMFKKGPLMKK